MNEPQNTPPSFSQQDLLDSDCEEKRNQLVRRTITDSESLSLLRDRWNTLAKESSATIFQTFEWLSLWWKFLGEMPHRTLQVILFYHDDRLVGIAPLFLHKESLLGISLHNRLSFLGSGMSYARSGGVFLDNGPSDYLDLLIQPGFEEEVCSSLLGYLIEYEARWDEMELVNIPHNSVVIHTLVPLLRARDWTCRVSRADICPRISTPLTMDEYFQNISASVRRRLVQAQRAAKESVYSISPADSLEECHNTLSSIITLHQKRWNRSGFPGLFSDDRFQLFQEAIVDAFYEHGWLWCKSAHADRTCVAARLGFKFGDTIYDYLSGFDDAAPAAKRRPGLALLLAMIEDAIHEHYSTLDLLRGDEAYKFELTSDSRYNCNITIERAHSAMSLGKTLHRVFKTISLLGFLMAREWKLLQVHYRESPLYRFFFQYVRFRSQRFISKLKQSGKNRNFQ